jgi:hypothetical protein
MLATMRSRDDVLIRDGWVVPLCHGFKKNREQERCKLPQGEFRFEGSRLEIKKRCDRCGNWNTYTIE